MFWEKLELQDFPMDIQELNILLESKKKPNEIRLSENKTDFQFNEEVCETFVDQQKWVLYNYVHINHNSLVSSYKHNLNQENNATKLRATCYASRKPQYYFWNAYFLIFLINICSFSIFAIDYKLVQSRLQTTFTILLTSISFKWVINRSLPTVSYLTSLDIYSIANIIFLCAVGISHASLSLIKDSETGINANFIVLMVFIAIFTLMHVFILLWFLKTYFKIVKLKQTIFKLQKNEEKSPFINQ